MAFGAPSKYRTDVLRYEFKSLAGDYNIVEILNYIDLNYVIFKGEECIHNEKVKDEYIMDAKLYWLRKNLGKYQLPYKEYINEQLTDEVL